MIDAEPFDPNRYWVERSDGTEVPGSRTGVVKEAFALQASLGGWRHATVCDSWPCEHCAIDYEGFRCDDEPGRVAHEPKYDFTAGFPPVVRCTRCGEPVADCGYEQPGCRGVA